MFLIMVLTIDDTDEDDDGNDEDHDDDDGDMMIPKCIQQVALNHNFKHRTKSD